MPGIKRLSHPLCARCLRASPTSLISNVRHASNSTSPSNQDGDDGGQDPDHAPSTTEQGAMSRRLQDMSEESLVTGGRSARKAVEEAGFSEELKRKLEEKIANANFRNEHAGAFAEANLPASAGRQTRDIAAAAPWSGTESVGDASLRMLTDVHKPLRTPSKPPGIRGPPAKVDTGRSRNPTGTGTRLANARDRSSFYSFVQDAGLSEQEREKFRQQMKQRFQPGARAIPATLQGLASLANERIEDAIARGQFKNLPRGQKIERDHNANSPFINTTEYFMNKMIQRQDIVPPWIEKQQEVVATATRFRSRLRADWKRHVARVIASQGGSLENQMKMANAYAYAERVANPTRKVVEQMNSVDEAGHISQITITGEFIPQPTESGTSEVEEIKVNEQPLDATNPLHSFEPRDTVKIEHPEIDVSERSKRAPTLPVFRDPKWEETERSYQLLAIESLNSLTRSYNLMAPNLAKKPYFSLDRELRSCFADVAPQVAAAIRERALAPKIKGVEIIGHKPGGVLEKFSMDKASHVYDERKPQYGFKEFWRDLFASKA